jgi:hypothetical protein
VTGNDRGWEYVKEEGPSSWLVAADLQRDGELVRHYGGCIRAYIVVCDECGGTQRWAAYSNFGQMPPEWSTFYGPDLCGKCTKKRVEAAQATKPPA